MEKLSLNRMGREQFAEMAKASMWAALSKKNSTDTSTGPLFLTSDK